MPIHPAPGETYTIRRKVFKIFGGAYHVYGPKGELVGFCEQKAFKLKEDMRLYTDASKSAEVLRIRTRQVIDFSGSYEVSLPSGDPIGTLRRKGFKSLLRDEWHVLAPDGRQVATIREESTLKALVRRFTDFSLLFPQKFTVTGADGSTIGTLRSHFNPFVYRLGVAIVKDDPNVDELILLAAGILVAAIEGRQG